MEYTVYIYNIDLLCERCLGVFGENSAILTAIDYHGTLDW